MLYNASLKELKLAMGRLDAAHAYSEVALRCFERLPEYIADESGFVKACSADFGPRLDLAKPQNGPTIRAQLYVLSLFSLFEEFLMILNRESISIRRQEIFPTSLSVNDAINALPLASDDWLVKKRILHYYRLIRNLAAHPHAKNAIRSQLEPILSSLNSASDKLYWRLLIPEIENYEFPLSGEISFDDCLICSRLLKTIGESLISERALQGSGELPVVKNQLVSSLSHLGVGTQKFRMRSINTLKINYCLDSYAAETLYNRVFNGV